MSVGKTILVAVVVGFLGQFCAFAEQSLSLEAKESKYQFPFFETKTSVWSYNDEIPGPLIRAQEGTTLVVKFLNNLKEASTIHWHGLRIENAMDGVPGVTQDPVKPGASFTYRLKLEEAGTYWYHPHFNSSEQLERGLKGAFIVEEAEKQPWSRELVWLVDDWLLQKDGNIYPKFNTGRDLMHDGRWGNVPTVNGHFRPEFGVRPGERVRLRLINGANARVFAPYLEGLAATVIAVDGRPVTRTFPLERFMLSPGNRVDLDITIPESAGGKVFAVLNRFGSECMRVSTPTIKAPLTRGTPRAERTGKVSSESGCQRSSWSASAIKTGLNCWLTRLTSPFSATNLLRAVCCSREV